MKKRLWGIALVFGLIFALGVPAFATNTVTNARILENDAVKEDPSATFKETSSDAKVFKVSFDVESSDQTRKFKLPAISATLDEATASLIASPFENVYWVSTEDSTIKIEEASLGDPVGAEDEENTTYHATAYLYIKLRGTEYIEGTENQEYAINFLKDSEASVLKITIEPYTNKTPSFDASVKTSLEANLGKAFTSEIKYDADTVLKGLDNPVTWSIDADGEEALAARNIYLNEDTGVISSDKVSYDTGWANFTITLITAKEPHLTYEKTFSLYVNGALTPTITPELVSTDNTTVMQSGDDIGIFHDTYHHGLYVGEKIADTPASSDIKFTIKGFSPLYIASFDESLPEGLLVDYGEESPDLSDGTGGLNAVQTITIYGTPKEATDGFATFTITVSNDVASADNTNYTEVSKTFKVTVLEYPSLTSKDADIKWGKLTSVDHLVSADFLLGRGYDAVVWGIDDTAASGDTTSTYLTAASLDALGGFAIDTEKGQITAGTWDLNASNDKIIKFTGDATSVDKKVRITAKQYGRTASADLTLHFIMVEPVISVDFMHFKYSVDVSSKDTTDTIVTAYGAGAITFTKIEEAEADDGEFARLVSRDLKSVESYDAEGNRTLIVYGKPTNTLLVNKYKFKAENAAGTGSADVSIDIKTDIIDIEQWTSKDSDIPHGTYVNGAVVEKTIYARPGLVDWDKSVTFTEAEGTATITLSGDPVLNLDESKSDDAIGMYAYDVTFVIKGRTGTIDKKKVFSSSQATYTLGATTSDDSKATGSITGTVTIKGAPQITSPKFNASTKKADKGLTITLDKDNKKLATIKADSTVAKWDIRFKYGKYDGITGYDPTDEITNNHLYENVSNDNYVNAQKAYIVYGGEYTSEDEEISANDYVKAIYRTYDEKENVIFVQKHKYLTITGDGTDTATILGSLDRMPEVGNVDSSTALTIRVYAISESGDVGDKEEANTRDYDYIDFSTTVKGTVPKLGKIDKTALTVHSADGNTPYTYTLVIPTTGTRPIDMSGKIDTGTALKLFQSIGLQGLTNKSDTDGINITWSEDDGMYGIYGEYYEDIDYFDESTPDGMEMDAVKAVANKKGYVVNKFPLPGDNPNENPTRLIFWHNKFDGVGYLRYKRYGKYTDGDDSQDVDGQAYKGIPVTITMENQASKAKNKPSTGSVKLSTNDDKATGAMKIMTPVWYVYNAASEDWVAVTDEKGKGVLNFTTANNADGPVAVDSTDMDKIFGVSWDMSGTDTSAKPRNAKTKIRNAKARPRNVKSGGVGEDIDLAKTLTFKVMGDGPLTVTATPTQSAKNKIYVESYDFAYYWDIENDGATDGRIFHVTGTPEGGKESKASIKLTAKNNSTGKQAALTVNIQALARPTNTMKYKDEKKSATSTYTYQEVEFGKKVSLKGAAGGSKTGLHWDVYVSDDSPYTSSKDLEDKYGLILDATKGTLAGTVNKSVTSVDNAYKSIDIYLQAINTVGATNGKKDDYGVQAADPIHFKLNIKGAKLKAANDTKTLTFERLSADSVNKALLALESAAEAANDAKTSVTYKLDEKSQTAVKDLGFAGTVTPVTSTGTLTNKGKLALASGNTAPTKASKGVSIKWTATNYGNSTITGSSKVVVVDPVPVITYNGEPTGVTRVAASTTATLLPVYFAKSSDQPQTATVKLKLTDTTGNDTKATGDSKVAWKVTKKPTGGLSAKVTAGKTDLGNTAEITLTLKKGDTAGGEFSLQATNSSQKSNPSAEYTIRVGVGAAPNTNAKPQDVAELPTLKEEVETEEPEVEVEVETETEPEAEEEEEVTGKITFGEPRTKDSLTDAQRAAIEEAGYQIIAVLPETEVDKSGQYDIDADLIEESPVGGELAYFAFPVEAETTEDDTIVDFSDETGELIYVVPEAKKVVVSPWLTEGKKYAPVVAVKVDKTAGAKDEAEGLAEGDVVSEEAMKEATEPVAEGDAEAQTPAEAPAAETETGTAEAAE